MSAVLPALWLSKETKHPNLDSLDESVTVSIEITFLGSIIYFIFE